MKPREWWICQTEGYDGDAYNTDPATWNPPGNPLGENRKKYHVIEYRAYKSLLELCEKLNAALKNECCCTGEIDWKTNERIKCDPCEAIAAHEDWMKNGK